MSFASQRLWIRLAALCGLAGVAFGAFGAHGVSDPRAEEWLGTGALYAFVHGGGIFASLLAISLGAARARHAPAFFLAGVVLFSGSLWAMALDGPRWLGVITPVGGLAFMVGWAVLAWSASDIDRPV